MKTILIALNAEKPDPESLVFGCYLARLTGSGLTGIFLEELPAENTPGLKFAYGGVYVETIGADQQPERAFKERACHESVRQFKAACEAQGIACKVHRDQGVAVEELLTESRYADLMIAGPQLLAPSALAIPSVTMQELLSKAECPVIIAPHRTMPLDNILFAHDGSASSLFAIRQFTCLFPELKNAALIVLEADEHAVFDAEKKEKLYEYLIAHYGRIDFKNLRGKAKDELFDYTVREVNACLVMGAYGRSWLSKLFKNSTADLLIKLNNLPLFITHR